MTAFLRPALVNVASTIVFLVLIDLGFHLVRTVPGLSALAPQSVVRYLEYGVSVPGKLDRAAAAKSPILAAGWLPASAEAGTERGLSASQGRYPTRGGSPPCATFYGMSFSNRMSATIEDQFPGEFELRRVAGPAAPPNWTLAAYFADREASDCRDVVVWTILSVETDALSSPSMLLHGFDAPQAYSLPAMTTQDGVVDARWPRTRSRDQLLSSLTGDWRAEFAEEDAFVDAAWGWRWADRSTLLGFVRRGLAVNAIAAREAAVTGSPEALRESGAARTLGLMAERFVAAAKADGSEPIILVVRNRAENAGITAALCEAGPSLPVFDTGLVVDPNDTSQFEADGHYLPEVDAEVGARFRDAMLTGAPGCDALPAD